MSEAQLVMRDLELVYPTAGVGPLNLELSPGGNLVILGRNGAGKSTLLRSLAGLLTPRSGQVSLGGHEVGAMSPGRRAEHMAFVASTPPRGSALTVGDVVGLALEAGSKSAGPSDVAAALEMADIADWIDVQLDALSDGMAQRVMMARAFNQAGSMVLLDEPTAFLDVVGRREVMHDLGKWCASGKSVVLATHDLEAVEQAGWANRWLVLRTPEQGGSLLLDEAFNAQKARSILTGEA